MLEWLFLSLHFKGRREAIEFPLHVTVIQRCTLRYSGPLAASSDS